MPEWYLPTDDAVLEKKGREKMKFRCSSVGSPFRYSDELFIRYEMVMALCIMNATTSWQERRERKELQ